MQEPARLKAFAIVAHRPEQWPLCITAMSGKIEIITNALCCLRVNGKTPLLAAFADHLQRIEAAIHVEVPDLQAGDLRATKPNLQSDCQNCPVTHTKQCVGIRRIKNRSCLLLGPNPTLVSLTAKSPFVVVTSTSAK
jgi:hypothetical protein